MGVFRQGLDVRYTKIRCTGGKGIVEGVHGEGRIPTGTASADDQPLGISQTLFRKPARPRHRILYIGNTPGSVKCLAISATKTRTTPVVQIQDRKAATGPIVVLRPVAHTRHGGGPSMHGDDEWWSTIVRCANLGIGWRKVNTMGFTSAGYGEGHLLKVRNPSRCKRRISRTPDRRQSTAIPGGAYQFRRSICKARGKVQSVIVKHEASVTHRRKIKRRTLPIRVDSVKGFRTPGAGDG